MLTRIALLCVALAAVLRAEPEYPKMGADIYDRSIDATPKIAAAVEQAAKSHKHVLLMFGANWCVWCHRLHTTLEKNPDVARTLRDNYELVMVDVNRRNGPARNVEVDHRYGDPTKLGLPVLVVLDARGNRLTTQDSGELEDGKSAHDPAKIVAFLERWSPKPATAAAAR